MPSSNELRDKCQYYRLKAGYKQKELADQLYVVPSTLSKWENGNSPWSSSALTRYCEILELTEEEKQELFILARIDSPTPVPTGQISKELKEEKALKSSSETSSAKGETEYGTVALKDNRQRWIKWGILGIGLIMIILYILIFWIRRNPEPPSWQTVFGRRWMQISAKWENVNESTALLIENNPDEDFGKVESEVITVNIDKYPILRINVEAIDLDSSYTVQILDKQTDIPKDVLNGIIYPGEHIVNLAKEMGWQGSPSFTINIWISGEGKSARFDLISIEAE